MTTMEETRRDLIALAVKHGSDSPIHHRAHGLIQLTKNFERTTDKETKARLLIGIQKKTREIANLLSAAA